MIRYIIKRILIILPTICIISILAFGLSKSVPQDVVISTLNNRGVKDPTKLEYTKTYRELKLDQPNFYFSIIPNFYPDNLNAIDEEFIRSDVQVALSEKYHWTDIKKELDNPNYNLGQLVDILDKDYTKVNFYLPKFVWHGLGNQYHRWLSSFFDNQSMLDGKSSISKVGKALQWTLSITISDLLLSTFLSFLLGYFFIKNNNSKFLKYLNQGLYFLYSIPIFWLATLMVVYLTTDDYGKWTNLFPSVGIDIFPGKSTLYHIYNNAEKLILPILCLTLHSLSYTTRFLSRSLKDEMRKPYIQTAYSKGINRNIIIKKHAIRNALVPMITIIVSGVANAFAGSLLIEVIFNIPGIGRLLYNSIGHADWNVVFSIVMVIAIVTSIIYLIGDILYAYINPKVKYES